MDHHTVEQCSICGGSEFKETNVLWDDLINAWGISHEEVEYINLQQGFQCKAYGANLRSMALAEALLRARSGYGLLQRFVQCPNARGFTELEINGGGTEEILGRQSPR